MTTPTANSAIITFDQRLASVRYSGSPVRRYEPLDEQHHRRERDPEVDQRDVHGERQGLHLPGLEQVGWSTANTSRLLFAPGAPTRPLASQTLWGVVQWRDSRFWSWQSRFQSAPPQLGESKPPWNHWRLWCPMAHANSPVADGQGRSGAWLAGRGRGGWAPACGVAAPGAPARQHPLLAKALQPSSSWPRGGARGMKSAVPKVLHDVCGWPMVLWPVKAAQARGRGEGIVVVEARPAVAERGAARGRRSRRPGGAARDRRRRALGGGPDRPRCARAHPVGRRTAYHGGHDPGAGRGARGQRGRDHGQRWRPTSPVNTAGSYAGPAGVDRVVEAKSNRGDATAAELAIHGDNTGIYAFDGGRLLDALQRITPSNAQGEYYLPDVLEVFRGDDHGVAAFPSAESLDRARRQRPRGPRACAAWPSSASTRRMRAGVTIVDPLTTLIDADVSSDGTRSSSPAASPPGRPGRGRGCRIGPLTTLIDMTLRDRVSVPHSYLQVQSRSTTTPPSAPSPYLRPGTVVPLAGAKIGTFVEVKNSDVGERDQGPHLSYIGDADIGERLESGREHDHRELRRPRTRPARPSAGTCTDGIHGLVAPVELGDDSWTAAGSAIVEDVPPAPRCSRAPVQRRGYDERKKRGNPTVAKDAYTRAAMRAPRTPSRGRSAPASIRLRQAAHALLGTGESRAAAVARRLGVDLGGVTLKTFSNGEVYCRYDESIRGADVFIVQPICGNLVTGVRRTTR